MIARVAKRIYMHRHEFGIGELFNPLTYVGVTAVTLAMDLGTFTGWVKALTHRNQVNKNTIAQPLKINQQ